MGGDAGTTEGGAAYLEPTIDPSRIGKTVKLDFDTATSYTYTQANYDADVARADSFSSPLIPLASALGAMRDVVQELSDEGTINTVWNGKLVLYGSEDADVISGYTSRIDHIVSDPYIGSVNFFNPLHEYTEDGLIYIAGAGNDIVTGTPDDDGLIGGEGVDQLFGGEGNDSLTGGAGADELYGGAGNDVLVFDAGDTAVFGGAGRDVAVAVTDQGVAIDMTASEVEVVIGGAGNDTIVAGDSGEARFIAGGEGDDEITVRYGDGQGPRIVWGGGGNDEISLVVDSDTTDLLDMEAGIAVVQVAGLTEQNFGSLTLEMLNLDGIDLSKIDVIILNPDTDDTYLHNISTSVLDIGTHTLGTEYLEYYYADGEQFTLDIKPNDYLGETRNIQAVYDNGYWGMSEIWVQTDDEYDSVYAITIYAGGASQGYLFDPYDESDQAQARAIIDGFVPTPFYEPPGTTDPDSLVFITGGSFSGDDLSSDGSISATMPDNPASSLPDWLLS